MTVIEVESLYECSFVHTEQLCDLHAPYKARCNHPCSSARMSCRMKQEVNYRECLILTLY
jgi:hypothetical protein